MNLLETTLLILLILLILYIQFVKPKRHYLSRWNVLIDGAKFPTLQFYQDVKTALSETDLQGL